MEGDWEVLDRSGREGTLEGLIDSDHFSLDTNNKVKEPSEDGSSGSPGWIEPRSDALYGPKHFSELWSDSSSDRVEDDDDNDDVGSRGEVHPRGSVWWKLPIHLFRANPIWSFSMAAAFFGFVILGRKLYNMKKKKTPTLHLKLLPHDKKVANKAPRLNEAISMVKRVPIIRPALPSTVGMNQWSMMRV